jgi:predicted AAA+ superfamily ATPase
VVAGLWQVGKTTLAQQVVAAAGVPVRDASADEPTLRRPGWIAEQWEVARLKMNGKPGILVLDEVQKVVGWFESLKRLWDEDTRRRRPLRVVLLGSALLLIQKRLTESLAGRFEVLHLPHWSFSETRAALGFSLEQNLYFRSYPGAAPLAVEPGRGRRSAPTGLQAEAPNREHGTAYCDHRLYAGRRPRGSRVRGAPGRVRRRRPPRQRGGARGLRVLYRRKRNREVDFVVRLRQRLVAIEVKSGRRREALFGMELLAQAYCPVRRLLIGADKIAVKKFLSYPVEERLYA